MVGPVAVLGGAALIAVSWHVARFYETPIEKSRRIAELFPQTPHVWEQTAWAYHEAERYEEAITLAEREFAHDDNCARSTAHRVIGVSQFRLGDHDRAFNSLERAIDTDPANSPAKFDLAKMLEEVGRLEEALKATGVLRKCRMVVTTCGSGGYGDFAGFGVLRGAGRIRG